MGRSVTGSVVLARQSLWRGSGSGGRRHKTSGEDSFQLLNTCGRVLPPSLQRTLLSVRKPFSNREKLYYLIWNSNHPIFEFDLALALHQIIHLFQPLQLNRRNLPSPRLRSKREIIKHDSLSLGSIERRRRMNRHRLVIIDKRLVSFIRAEACHIGAETSQKALENRVLAFFGNCLPDRRRLLMLLLLLAL